MQPWCRRSVAGLGRQRVWSLSRGRLQSVGQLERLVQPWSVQERQQGAPRVLQCEVCGKDVFDEAQPLHLQPSQLGPRDLALLQPGAVERDHTVDFLERRLSDAAVGLSQHGGQIRAPDIKPDLPGAVLHAELSAGATRFGDLCAKASSSRRLEFLIEPNGELLTAPVAGTG